MRVFWGAYTLWNICVGISRMATNVRLSTEDLIKDIQKKLQETKYTGKADELKKDLKEVDTKIRRYKRAVAEYIKITSENKEDKEDKEAKQLLRGYEEMLKKLEKIHKGLSEVVVVANTSSSANAAANALSRLTLGGAPPAAAGPAAAAPAAAAPAAAGLAVQEVHVCPEGVGELFRLGGDELKDGNCFYSSIYKAALHHSEKGLVNRIYELFDGKYAAAPAAKAAAPAAKAAAAPAAKAASAPAAKASASAAAAAKPIPEERIFIMALRAKTAQLMRTGVFEEIKQRRIRNVNADPSIGKNRATEAEKEALRQQQRDLVFTLFDKLWENSEGDNKIVYDAWLEESPTEIRIFIANRPFRTIYPANNRENEQKFYNDMATFIQTWKVYASETDISVVRHHLSKSGIALEAVSAIDTKKCMYFGIMPVLWLFKQAFYDGTGKLVSGNHFGYFRKDDCSTLHDPCSGERINLDHLSHPRNPVKYLEEKIKIIAAAHAARLEGGGGGGGGGGASAAAAAAAAAANAAAFGLTPADLKEQKEAWAKLKGQKPPGNTRKTRKMLSRRRSRSRRIQRKA